VAKNFQVHVFPRLIGPFVSKDEFGEVVVFLAFLGVKLVEVYDKRIAAFARLELVAPVDVRFLGLKAQEETRRARVAADIGF
jgi:hypothetical protein